MTNRERVLEKYPEACAVPHYSSFEAIVPINYNIQTNGERYLPNIIGSGSTATEAWQSAARRLEEGKR